MAESKERSNSRPHSRRGSSNSPTRYPLYDPSYNATQLHQDLEDEKYIGMYGSNNSGYLGLCEAKTKLDLHSIQKQRSKDEYYIPALDAHLKKPETQARWNEIVSMDPRGMWATRPTIAATYAKMYLAEMSHLNFDGVVVAEDGGINCVKCAVDYVWNLPGLSSRLQVKEEDIRKGLFKYTQNPRLVEEKNIKPYLPATGAITLYFIGDISKLGDKKTEVAVRVHDECNGSDVFGTDICTCRPYLMFAVQGAVECAQRGGVGIIAYFRKEGRALGEVTKFRVYNARKMQAGGDRPEMYFAQTESIAGVRDARFQELMPDVLLWLGITRIDWLMSMSSDKFGAIDNAGIQVMQRISLPDEMVPKGAAVEITAKISAGYHTDKISSVEIQEQLRELKSVRERCLQIFELAEHDNLHHFTMDISKLPVAVKAVVDCINKFHPDLKIPYHSRMRHFEANNVDRITPLVNSWPCDQLEKVRRILDLVCVSVLLDAGAGADWKYVDADGNTFVRSEGLAIASLDMFCSGIFSSDEALPHRVNSLALKRLKKMQLSTGLQISKTNTIIGLDGRLGILQRLGEALETSADFFGAEVSRPGHILDYLLRHCDAQKRVSVNVLWKAIMEGFDQVWPTSLSGVRRGDMWVYTAMKQIGVAASDMVPFHKLSQWLMLSMLEPLESIGIKFTDMDSITALAEYRNGGLFVDTGVISLRDPAAYALEHPVGSELVVEWRALTVCLIDLVADEVRKHYPHADLSLPKILEGGTWRAGRIVAKEKRADGSPPIKIRSDGTVF
jgi:GTP cyclohydrolase II